MRLPVSLARRWGSPVSVTAGLESFAFDGPELDGRPRPFRPATALRFSGELKITALGDEALDARATGVLVRIFQSPPRPGEPWAEEGFLVMYCRYCLALVGSDVGSLRFFLGIGPVVTVHEARALHSFFRGRETEVLDRVLRAAGASVVEFAS